MKQLYFVLLMWSCGCVQADVARDWNEAMLDAIRGDQARPTVHARNLYHVSAAMWDAWAAYDEVAEGVFFQEKLTHSDTYEARQAAISYASYRVLTARFSTSASASQTLAAFDQLMGVLGYDINVTVTQGNEPAAVGNRVAAVILAVGAHDGSNEANQYENQFYQPVNQPLLPDFSGNPDITDPNRWQPLALDFFQDQSGVVLGEYPDFLSPEWGLVDTFAMTDSDLTVYQRGNDEYRVYKDPGAPPLFGSIDDNAYREGFEQVLAFSQKLDVNSGQMIDISPLSRGNSDLGLNNGTGRAVNPVSGQPYVAQWVNEGDYYRVLAEFWADGPDSETPPGHWFTLLNYVSDHIDFEKRWQGKGEVLPDLEWEVKSYLAMGGTVHDAAVAAWSVKGWYDYIRPISAIRFMCDNGQSSDVNALSYHEGGVRLVADLVELVTSDSILPGERHAHLSGFNGANVGKIAVNTWRGPDYINNPETDVAGVGWILCENWWPYQRPSFVTPPFAGYVSGHSTFSRAAAELMTLITGSAYFPGGMGEFIAPANDFLVFEAGPSDEVTLQWATYQDASDECSLSRIYGGIHPPADDIPGRLMGYEIGHQGFARVNELIQGNQGSGALVRPVPLGDFLIWFLVLGVWAVVAIRVAFRAGI